MEVDLPEHHCSNRSLRTIPLGIRRTFPCPRLSATTGLPVGIHRTFFAETTLMVGSLLPRMRAFTSAYKATYKSSLSSKANDLFLKDFR